MRCSGWQECRQADRLACRHGGRHNHAVYKGAEHELHLQGRCKPTWASTSVGWPRRLRCSLVRPGGNLASAVSSRSTPDNDSCRRPARSLGAERKASSWVDGVRNSTARSSCCRPRMARTQMLGWPSRPHRCEREAQRSEEDREKPICMGEFISCALPPSRCSVPRPAAALHWWPLYQC